MLKISPIQTPHYQKWFEYFEPHLQRMFAFLLDRIVHHQIDYCEYEFDDFCALIYNKSSKRIPKY